MFPAVVMVQAIIYIRRALNMQIRSAFHSKPLV